MRNTIAIFAALVLSIAGFASLAIADISQYELDMPGDISGLPGAESISVPIRLTAAGSEAYSSADLWIGYDKDRFDAVQVAKGDLTQGPGWELVYKIYPGTGEVRIAIFNKDSLTPGAIGNVAVVTFNVKAGAAVGSSSLDFNFLQLHNLAVPPANATPGAFAVLQSNRAPIAVAGAESVDEDGSVDIDVLALCSDPDGDALEITDVSIPSNGEAVIAEGLIKYTPEANYFGDDSFSYTISDGDLTASADVAITVNAINDAPVVLDILGQSVNEGASFLAINLDDFVTDVDNAKTEIAWSASGNIDLSIDITNRVATIAAPDENWSGSETILFTAKDPDLAEASDLAIFSVNSVNDLPTAVADSAETKEKTLVHIDVLANDSDPDIGDVLSIDSIVTQPFNGNAVINGGYIDYTPTTNDFIGEDMIEYKISDGNGGFASAMVTVTVNVIYGDVNGDTNVRQEDALEAAKTAVGLITLSSTRYKAANVDGDGNIDAADASLIARFVAGLIAKFPVEQ